MVLDGGEVQDDSEDEIPDLVHSESEDDELEEEMTGLVLDAGASDEDRSTHGSSDEDSKDEIDDLPSLDVFKELAGHNYYCRLSVRLPHVLPMGLEIYPSGFARHMQHVLKPFLGKFCVTHLDVIGIYSDSLEDHTKHFCLVLAALREHDLCCVPPQPSHYCQPSMEFWGHMVSADGGAKLSELRERMGLKSEDDDSEDELPDPDNLLGEEGTDVLPTPGSLGSLLPLPPGLSVSCNHIGFIRSPDDFARRAGQVCPDPPPLAAVRLPGYHAASRVV